MPKGALAQLVDHLEILQERASFPYFELYRYSDKCEIKERKDLSDKTFVRCTISRETKEIQSICADVYRSKYLLFPRRARASCTEVWAHWEVVAVRERLWSLRGVVA